MYICKCVPVNLEVEQNERYAHDMEKELKTKKKINNTRSNTSTHSMK